MFFLSVKVNFTFALLFWVTFWVTVWVTTSVTLQTRTTTAFATVGQKWVTVLPPTLPIISFYTLITSNIFSIVLGIGLKA